MLTETDQARILLYNLPFSSRPEPHTVETLLEDGPNTDEITDKNESRDIRRSLALTRSQASLYSVSGGFLGLGSRE